LKWNCHLPFGNGVGICHLAFWLRGWRLAKPAGGRGGECRRGECRGGEWGENAGEEEEEEEDQGVRIQLNNMCNYDSNESR